MNKSEFEQACRELDPLAIKALERALREGGSSSLKAAELLLAYTQGKPAQEVNATVSNVGGALINITYVAAQEGRAMTIEHQATPAVPEMG